MEPTDICGQKNIHVRQAGVPPASTVAPEQMKHDQLDADRDQQPCLSGATVPPGGSGTRIEAGTPPEETVRLQLPSRVNMNRSYASSGFFTIVLSESGNSSSGGRLRLAGCGSELFCGATSAGCSGVGFDNLFYPV